MNREPKPKPKSGRRPRPNPVGESPVKQGAGAAAGAVLVAVLGVAALLVSPSFTAPSAGDLSEAEGVEGQSPGNGPGGGLGTPSSIVPTGEVTSVEVSVDGMAFVPNVIEVPAGNTLQVTFENTGDQRHDLLFGNGAEIEPLAPGASAQVEVGTITSNMEGWCTLPGHRQMGMELTVVAVGADVQSPSNTTSTSENAEHAEHAGSTGPINMAALVEEAEKHDPYPAVLDPLPADSKPQTREFTFAVTEDEEDLTQGVVRPLWEFDGSSPGPTLRGNVGDEFVITLVNEGTMGHSIDFHAGENSPDEVMRTIEPGESLEYRFTAGRSGIWMYHCSTMPMSTHIANGMFGAVVIDPPNLPKVDREYIMIQSEFYVDEDGTSAAEKMNALTPDVTMFNGRAFQYDAHPLQAKVGERVRFWVLDVGPNAPLAFHIVGTQFDTWWSEGRYGIYHGKSTDGITEGVTGSQVLPLQAAQGGFVELVAPEPGNYPIVNHIMSLAEQGAHGTLQVE